MYTINGFGEMAAAADFMGPGAIETPRYESEIVDLVRRRGVLGQRIPSVPATGQPSRYFEQTTIIPGVFVDPRNMSYNPTPHPTRRERALTIKALYGSVHFTHFDVEVTQQQGQFSALVAKDMNDAIEGLLRTSDIAIWNGSDTDLVMPTSMEYVGALNQINRTASIGSSASIIDGLKAEVAAMMANTAFAVRPTAIYLNPVLGDLIDAEERANQRQVDKVTVAGGLLVNAIATQAGTLPLIPDWTLQNGPSAGSSIEAGKTDYKAVIVSENMIERQYVGSPTPRVFELGREGSLATRYAIILYDAVVFKGKANSTANQAQAEGTQTSYSHSLVTVVR